MRTWGRITNPDGSRTWKLVETTADGFNDFVQLTTLAQTLLLNVNESPFFANYGIPARDSVQQQVFPDYWAIVQIQQQFASQFASLIIAKEDNPIPHYRINVITHNGVKLNRAVPIPT